MKHREHALHVRIEPVRFRRALTVCDFAAAVSCVPLTLVLTAALGVVHRGGWMAAFGEMDRGFRTGGIFGGAPHVNDRSGLAWADHNWPGAGWRWFFGAVLPHGGSEPFHDIGSVPS